MCVVFCSIPFIRIIFSFFYHLCCWFSGFFHRYCHWFRFKSCLLFTSSHLCFTHVHCSLFSLRKWWLFCYLNWFTCIFFPFHDFILFYFTHFHYLLFSSRDLMIFLFPQLTLRVYFSLLMVFLNLFSVLSLYFFPFFTSSWGLWFLNFSCIFFLSVFPVLRFILLNLFSVFFFDYPAA